MKKLQLENTYILYRNLPHHQFFDVKCETNEILSGYTGSVSEVDSGESRKDTLSIGAWKNIEVVKR